MQTKKKEIKQFYKNKTVFITGHTGFKGSWLCQMLYMLGANVYGYALEPPTKPSLYEELKLEDKIHSTIGDIRDLQSLKQTINHAAPEIVIHMAAQPLVRESYNNPVDTYETNVMGTVNFLEAVRACDTVKSVINVTTDKVYKNKEWQWGYRENEELNGFDPYSNSKSCSELVTDCYINSFFANSAIAISTARAGNVIGGGDFAQDRIIPDCIRAIQRTEDIIVRNPYSIRPYQHVLEPLYTYLLIAMEQYNDTSKMGTYNIGPEESDCYTTANLVTMFCEKWNKTKQDSQHKIQWINKHDGGPHEANFLKLDCSKVKHVFGWNATWNMEEVISLIVEWYDSYLQLGDMDEITKKQIQYFFDADNVGIASNICILEK